MTSTPQSSHSVDSAGGFEGKWSPKAQFRVSSGKWSVVRKLIHYAVYIYLRQLTIFTV